MATVEFVGSRVGDIAVLREETREAFEDCGEQLLALGDFYVQTTETRIPHGRSYAPRFVLGEQTDFAFIKRSRPTDDRHIYLIASAPTTVHVFIT